MVTATLLVALLAAGWWWFAASNPQEDVQAPSTEQAPATRWVVIDSSPPGGVVSLDGMPLGKTPLQVKFTEGTPKVYQIQGATGEAVFVVVDGKQNVVRGTLPQPRRVQPRREVIPDTRPAEATKPSRSNSSDEVRDPWSQ